MALFMIVIGLALIAAQIPEKPDFYLMIAVAAADLVIVVFLLGNILNALFGKRSKN